jgi:hypothetical protein
VSVGMLQTRDEETHALHKCRVENSLYIHGTDVPVVETSTASKSDDARDLLVRRSKSAV